VKKWWVVDGGWWVVDLTLGIFENIQLTYPCTHSDKGKAGCFSI